eukprot:CAMPEP_0202724468 /NCGR_PEP_ID=MMETSP1385-20130828/173943_1 /ASSEMBLY_ACC=CAM_ASM_000861 /TAXON_ID=933848 /ORGANISM="Elphidium margaritaceum" /LENGTH=151 /DNA_ID=CAMNT_0049390061 /DNA_START=405 /DNA_END=856 /DNA_ORIENTATION=+
MGMQVITIVPAATLFGLQLVGLIFLCFSDVQQPIYRSIIDLFAVATMFVFFCGAAIVAFVFIGKLKSVLADPDGVDLSDVMTKVTLLIMVSVCTSIVFWILLWTEWSFGRTRRGVTYMYDTFIALDATTHVFCMYCSFPFGDVTYQKMFGA